jgi:hypothetical protein
MVRFNAGINPFGSIPRKMVQDVAVSATLVQL